MCNTTKTVERETELYKQRNRTENYKNTKMGEDQLKSRGIAGIVLNITTHYWEFQNILYPSRNEAISRD